MPMILGFLMAAAIALVADACAAANAPDADGAAGAFFLAKERALTLPNRFFRERHTFTYLYGVAWPLS